MAASSESGCSSKVRYYYETRVFTPENVDDDDPDSSFKAAHPIAAAAASPGTACSSSVLFKVQSILRLSVAGGNPMTEFLEENDWRETRQSSLELPCSKDGIIIDDKDNLKIISEALTALRVLKVSHQSIMDQLRQGAASLGLSPKFVVEICEVTHVTLPLIDEEGKRFMEEGETVLIPHNGDDEGDSVLIPENGDDEGQAVLIPDNDSEERIKKEELESLFALKILILDLGDINENDEAAKINDWFSEFINALCRVAWPEEEEQYEQEEEGEGDREGDGEEEEEGEGEGEEEEWVCPICREIFKQDEPWSEMPCCSQVFHCDCISMWNTERVKKCPWCRSSLPLVLQSAKGVIHRSNSEYFSSPI